MSQRTYLEDFAEVVIARVFATLFVSRPAKVERYDEEQQQVDARPLFQESFLAPDGTRQVKAADLIQNVPLCWPAGKGGYLSLPFDVGDTVGLVFLDRASDVWRSLGIEADPKADRRHHQSDCWAVPGLHSFNQPLLGVSKTNAILAVTQPGAEVHLGMAGDSAMQAVALAQNVLDQLLLIKAALVSLHASVAPVTGTALAALFDSFNPTAAAIGSSVVKASL